MNRKLRQILAVIALTLLGTAALATPTAITAFQPAALTAAISAGTCTNAQTASDVSNGNSCVSTGREILVANNTGGSAYTVTINSAADRLGRTADISAYSLAAGDVAFFGPFPQYGWQQSDGKLHFSGSNAGVKWSVIRVPNSI